jgi:hypothetical protein
LPDTLDFIGRFENLQEDMRKVAQIIGLPTVDLPHLVKTKHKHYSKYYDNETEQITRERYTRDIELFNYTFERSGYEGLLL